VKGVMEGSDWVYDAVNGIWKAEEMVHETRKELKEMSKSQREANALRLFEGLLSKLVNKI
jgi:hypothetical protein